MAARRGRSRIMRYLYWVSEEKRIRGKKLPLTAAGVQGLREEYTRSIEPARALAAETSNLERTLSDLVKQAYGLERGQTGDSSRTAPGPQSQPARGLSWQYAPGDVPRRLSVAATAVPPCGSRCWGSNPVAECDKSAGRSWRHCP